MGLALFLTVWFGAAVLFASLRVFADLPRFVPPLIPIGLALCGIGAYVASKSLREILLGLDITVLLSVGLLRIVGFYLVVPWAYQDVAWPAILPVAVTSLLVATGAFALMWTSARESRVWRRWVLAWNLFAIAQIAFTFGSFILHIMQGRPTGHDLLAGLPVNLFPTFVTPLSLIAHTVIFHHLYRVRSTRD